MEFDKEKNTMAKTSNKTESSSSSATAMVSLTHDQIAERAKSIWQKKGCPSGQDQKIWHEAEAQLKKEKGIK
jgi:hypothetical protein